MLDSHKYPGLAFRNIFQKILFQKEANLMKMKLCKNMNSILLRFFSSCAHSRVRDKLPCTAIMIKIKILPLNMKICATQATNCSISLQGPWACIYSQVSGHCGWGDLFHFVWLMNSSLGWEYESGVPTCLLIVTPSGSWCLSHTL